MGYHADTGDHATRRFPVDKKHDSKKFNKQSSKTHRANVQDRNASSDGQGGQVAGVMRGGIRL